MNKNISFLQKLENDNSATCREGDTATRHARTESVKCRIHSYRYKSRSVDNVMTTPEW